jgi:N-methylhydantoinase B
MAGWGRRFRMAVQGIDPRTEKPFIWHLFQARPGRRRLVGGRRLAGCWRVAGRRRYQVR